MNYKVEGSGEALVFIHGLSDSLLYWEFLAENLKKDFQIVRFDLRGHGDSPLGCDEITMGVYVNDLLNLLNELKVNKVNLVGFSLGGAIALKFAIEYPQKVSSLVLMSSLFKADNHLQTVFKKFINALENSFEDFYDLILPMILCGDVIDNNRDELEMLKHISAQTANTEAYIKATNACLNFDVEKELSEIQMPVLILAGKYDDITLLSSQKNMNEKIENSKLIVFDNVKHNLLVGENDSEVLVLLKNFFKK